VRRLDLDPSLGRRVDPACSGATAREDERMRPILVKNGELKVTVKWCRRDWLPHLVFSSQRERVCLDLDQ
jgi:hypothetical protein